MLQELCRSDGGVTFPGRPIVAVGMKGLALTDEPPSSPVPITLRFPGGLGTGNWDYQDVLKEFSCSSLHEHRSRLSALSGALSFTLRGTEDIRSIPGRPPPVLRSLVARFVARL